MRQRKETVIKTKTGEMTIDFEELTLVKSLIKISEIALEVKTISMEDVMGIILAIASAKECLDEIMQDVKDQGGTIEDITAYAVDKLKEKPKEKRPNTPTPSYLM